MNKDAKCNERNPFIGGFNPVSVLSLLCLLDITWEDLCGARLFFSGRPSAMDRVL